jgi:hypothetical protein
MLKIFFGRDPKMFNDHGLKFQQEIVLRYRQCYGSGFNQVSGSGLGIRSGSMRAKKFVVLTQS